MGFDLYSLVAKNGGKMLQDGSMWRDFVSKDGTKIIRQIAQKNGASAIDVFEQGTNKQISAFRKTIKPDGRSYVAKSYIYPKQKGSIFSVLRLEKNNSFMSTLFSTNQSGKINSTGDFVSVAGKQEPKKSKVTFYPISSLVSPKNPKLSLYTQTFNKLFGKVDTNIF